MTPSYMIGKCFLFFVVFALAAKFAVIVGSFFALALALHVVSR